jgi:hypothetical protein
VGEGLPGHMGINRNEIAHKLGKLSSSLPLIGPEPAFEIFAKFANEVMRGWTSRKREDYCSTFMDKGRLRAFLNILY